MRVDFWSLWVVFMNKKYVIWNNKGGVGKTFLTYVLASEYAINNPNEDVVVVDMCPQANVSEMILGGNGEGEKQLSDLANNGITIASYIKDRFNKSQFHKLGTELKYFVNANRYNEHMPNNLYLLPGDIDLDICSKLISYIASAPKKESWSVSRSLLIDLIDSFENNESEKPKTFFIDCNPSFAPYTELALLTANRLIVPCTADAASIRGIHNLIKMIYGVSLDTKVFPDEFLDFYHEVSTIKLDVPKLHLFIQNRSRTNDKSATRAYQAHADKIDELAQEIMSKYGHLFTEVNMQSRVEHIKDGNTLASILNHEGRLLSSLNHAKYNIYGTETQANGDQIEALLNDVKRNVQML